jgi:hypothetical protein
MGTCFILGPGLCYNKLFVLTRSEKDTVMAEKKAADLQEFIESVNKKDKLHGKRIKFGFTRRKRQK